MKQWETKQVTPVNKAGANTNNNYPNTYFQNQILDKGK